MDPTMILPLEIWQKIHDKLDFKSKCLMSLSCGLFRNGLMIIDLFDIDEKYLKRLNDKVLKYPMFKKARRLNAKYFISWDSKITQKGISELDLIELNAWSNSKITSVF